MVVCRTCFSKELCGCSSVDLIEERTKKISLQVNLIRLESTRIMETLEKMCNVRAQGKCVKSKDNNDHLHHLADM